MKKENRVLEAFARINATPEYVAKNEIAVHAISEIVKNDSMNIVNKEQCFEWLNRYKHFFNNFKGRSPIFFPTLEEFYNLYFKINGIYYSLDYKDEIFRSLKELKSDSIKVDKWFEKHEYLLLKIPFSSLDLKDGFIIVSSKHNLFISSVRYKLHIEFLRFVKYHV